MLGWPFSSLTTPSLGGPVRQGVVGPSAEGLGPRVVAGREESNPQCPARAQKLGLKAWIYPSERMSPTSYSIINPDESRSSLHCW